MPPSCTWACMHTQIHTQNRIAAGELNWNYIQFDTQLYLLQYTQKSPQQLSRRTDVSLHKQEVQGLSKGPNFISTAHLILRYEYSH